MNGQLLNGRALFAGRALQSGTRVCRRAQRCAAQAADRPTWLPGIEPPKHLNGSLPGDYGFDPLGLGKDPAALKWYAHAELIHGRWAMVAVAGILLPGIATAVGFLNLPPWYEAGRVAQLNAFAPFSTLLAVQLLLMGWVESKRWVDFFKPKSQGEKGSFLGFESVLAGSGTPGYPGGPFFDPFGFAKGSEESLKELKIKEIKNGRLALLAFLGFVAQYAATKKAPLENLGDHVLHPWGSNFTTNGISVPSAGLIK